MRLRRDQVERISKKIVQRLKDEGLGEFKATEKEILEEIMAIFMENLQAEQELENQADKMLERYRQQIESGQVDGRKLLLMIKKQLAKEKNFVL